MIPNLPPYIPLIFALTIIATLLLFIWAIKKASLGQVRKKAVQIFVGLVCWLAIQTIFTIQNIYNTNTNTLPPKILLLGVMPAILLLVILFTTKKGRLFIDSLPLEKLTYLHVIRIPVEMVLYWLFLSKAIPELMTFEGRNFDIVAGITAPIVAYFGFTKAKLGRQTILMWNIICLALLLNIVMNAFLSAPSPLQQFAFEQPNIAILNFPFSWLPTFVVPVVLFAHLVSIRQLLKKEV
jgi:hypothetical protein